MVTLSPSLGLFACKWRVKMFTNFRRLRKKKTTGITTVILDWIFGRCITDVLTICCDGIEQIVSIIVIITKPTYIYVIAQIGFS